MATLTQETRFDLARHDLVTLSAAADHVLHCRSGELWITFDGDRRDLILGAGASHRIDSNAPLVISALRESCLEVARQQAFSPRRAGAASLLVSLLNWEFPPLAAFPSPLIR